MHAFAKSQLCPAHPESQWQWQAQPKLPTKTWQALRVASCCRRSNLKHQPMHEKMCCWKRLQKQAELAGNLLGHLQYWQLSNYKKIVQHIKSKPFRFSVLYIFFACILLTTFCNIKAAMFRDRLEAESMRLSPRQVDVHPINTTFHNSRKNTL